MKLTNKAVFFIFILFSLVFTSCVTNQELIQDNNSKVERTGSSEYHLSSTTEVKEVVTDPITMDRCDKNASIAYDNNFFCSEESLDRYKKEKN